MLTAMGEPVSSASCPRLKTIGGQSGRWGVSKGKISILFSEHGLRIDIRDDVSSTMFAQIHLNQKQACQALSRLASTECEIETFGLDRVGKKMEMDRLSFPVPDRDKETAKKLVHRHCPDGWTPDLHFNSQDSFSGYDDNIAAHCTIRRWVEVEDSDNG